MNLNDLFEQGFLKKIPVSRERAKKSIDVAEKYFSDAEKSFEVGLYSMSIIAAYGSVFHAARAILFLDGVAERSHFAIHDYLKVKHKDFGLQLIDSFNLYRKLRHSVAYGLDTKIIEKDAVDAINFAQDFIEKVNQYLDL